MINYTWQFNPLQVIYNSGSMQNIITAVRYQLIATDTVSSNQKVFIDTVQLNPPTSESFIPFTSVTKEQVTSWVEAQLGNEVNDIKSRLSASIASELAPTSGIVSPPWIN